VVPFWERSNRGFGPGLGRIVKDLAHYPQIMNVQTGYLIVKMESIGKDCRARAPVTVMPLSACQLGPARGAHSRAWYDPYGRSSRAGASQRVSVLEVWVSV